VINIEGILKGKNIKHAVAPIKIICTENMTSSTILTPRINEKDARETLRQIRAYAPQVRELKQYAEGLIFGMNKDFTPMLFSDSDGMMYFECPHEKKELRERILSNVTEPNGLPFIFYGRRKEAQIFRSHQMKLRNSGLNEYTTLSNTSPPVPATQLAPGKLKVWRRCWEHEGEYEMEISASGFWPNDRQYQRGWAIVTRISSITTV